MKKNGLILRILILYFLVSNTGYGQLNKALNDKKIDIDEVTVSGLRATMIYSQISRLVTVIPKEVINSVPTGSINELLEYVGGIDIRNRGNFGVQADLSIRGGSFDQVLILLNGISISDPQTGHYNMDLPVDLESIERIEILRGPGSRVFGANAFSGVINIITKSEIKDDLTLSAIYGQYGYYKTGISSNIRTANIYNHISINRSESEGYINNTDFTNLNIFYQGRLKIRKNSDLEILIGHNDKAYGANSFYTPKYPNQFEKTKTDFSGLKFSTGQSLKISSLIYWRGHKDRFELFRENPASWYTGHNYHKTNVAGLNLSMTKITKFGKASLGFDYKTERIKSNVLGEELEKPIKVPGEPDGIYLKGHSRDNISLYLEYVLFMNKWAISGGVMSIINTDLDNGPDFFPGLDFSYNLLPDWKLYITANKALRLPTFTDLYYSGPTNIGNPELKPEEALSFESGIKLHKNRFNGDLSVFKRYGRNIIDWVKESEEEKWQSRNLTNVNALGLEININYRPYANLSNILRFNYLSFTYSYTQLDKSSENLISKYVLDNLKHKMTFGFNFYLFKKLGMDWKISYQDRAGGFINFSDGIYGEEQQYDPFWLTDMNLFYNFRNYKIYMDISNLFDIAYQDFGNLLQSGRWIRFGAKIHISHIPFLKDHRR